MRSLVLADAADQSLALGCRQSTAVRRFQDDDLGAGVGNATDPHEGPFRYTIKASQRGEILGGIEWVGVEETDQDELPSPEHLDIRQLDSPGCSARSSAWRVLAVDRPEAAMAPRRGR